jgi:hypothetical protein
MMTFCYTIPRTAICFLESGWLVLIIDLLLAFAFEIKSPGEKSPLMFNFLLIAPNL